VGAELGRRGVQLAAGPKLEAVVHLLKERASSTLQLADEAMLFYELDVDPGTPDWDEAAEQGLRTLRARLTTTDWRREAIGAAIRDTAKAAALKMPQLAMPLRRVVTGRTQTPSIDAVLELLGRDLVITRLSRHLNED